jgi:hypothetical protein
MTVRCVRGSAVVLGDGILGTLVPFRTIPSAALGRDD